MTDETKPLPNALRRELAKLVHAANPDQLHPFLADETFRAQKGCLASFIDPNHRNYRFNLRAATHNANAWLKQLYASPEEHIPPFTEKEVAQFFLEFAAGLQFAYEQAPWDTPDVHVGFRIDQDRFPSEGFGARVSETYETAVDEPSGIITGLRPIAAELNIDMVYVALHLLKMHRGMILFQGEYADFPDHGERLLAGIEEGRHLSQNLNRELSKQIMAETLERYGGTRPESISQDDYKTDPPEIDAHAFITSNRDRIITLASHLCANHRAK